MIQITYETKKVWEEHPKPNNIIAIFKIKSLLKSALDIQQRTKWSFQVQISSANNVSTHYLLVPE